MTKTNESLKSEIRMVKIFLSVLLVTTSLGITIFEEVQDDDTPNWVLNFMCTAICLPPLVIVLISAIALYDLKDYKGSKYTMDWR